MVEPETFTFLTDLAQNNRKVWMDAHRPERDDAMRNFTGIATTLHDYAHLFDYLVADARSKPKQSFTRFFQEPRDRIGSGLFRADVDVFANEVIRRKTLDITSISSQEIAMLGRHFSNHLRWRLHG